MKLIQVVKSIEKKGRKRMVTDLKKMTILVVTVCQHNGLRERLF